MDTGASMGPVRPMGNLSSPSDSGLGNIVNRYAGNWIVTSDEEIGGHDQAVFILPNKRF